MKDLYRRCGLKPYESDRSKLTNISQGSDEDQTACFSILLNAERKAVYDNTHRALASIAQVRREIDLPSNAQWMERYADFAEAQRDAAEVNSTNVNDISEASSGGAQTRTAVEKGSKAAVRKLGLVATAVVAVLIVVVVMLSVNDDSAESTVEMEQLHPPALMHVKTSNAAIYPKVLNADDFMDAIATLENQTEITVEKVSLDGEWVWVNLPSVKGFTLRSNLRTGPSERTIVERCREAGVQRPYTGVKNNFFHAGSHVLTLANPPGKDAIVKLKNDSGDIQLIAYIRSGEELIVEGVANGSHQLEYALGENYSEQCGRFLDHMQAFREEKTILYQGSELDENPFVDRYVYILKSEVVGLTPISNHLF